MSITGNAYSVGSFGWIKEDGLSAGNSISASVYGWIIAVGDLLEAGAIDCTIGGAIETNMDQINDCTVGGQIGVRFTHGEF